MTQYLQSHFKLPLDATRYSLGRVEFEKFSRLGEHAPRPPRKSMSPKKEPPLLKVWLWACYKAVYQGYRAPTSIRYTKEHNQGTFIAR